MAEYIGIPVSKENANQAPESFQAICNLWIKSEHWTLEDAVRLLTGIAPSAFEPEKTSPNKSFKVIFAIAKNCINESLDVLKTNHLEEIRVNPFDFLLWAKNKELPVPTELDIAVNSAKYNQKKYKEKIYDSTKNNHRERCRCIASLLWSKHPQLTIDEMIARTEIFEFGCEKERYSEELIKNWIIDLTLDKN